MRPSCNHNCAKYLGGEQEQKQTDLEMTVVTL